MNILGAIRREQRKVEKQLVKLQTPFTCAGDGFRIVALLMPLRIPSRAEREANRNKLSLDFRTETGRIPRCCLRF